MKTVRYASLARKDLLDIWLHIAERNPNAADRVFDLIEDRCRRLKTYPQLGPGHPDIGEGARVLIIERWLALYRLVEDGVQIARIVDGARILAQLGLPSDWL